MVKVSFSRSDYQRRVAGAAAIPLKNRFFEANPSLSEDGAALVARPGLRHFVTVGNGPIRGLMQEPGAFSSDIFAASGDTLYRVTPAGDSTAIFVGLSDPDFGTVRMAMTQAIGVTPEYLFIADGAALYVYESPSATAESALVESGAISSGNQVRIGDVYYQFTNSSVDTGTPDGSSGNPWLVAMGSDVEEALENFYHAINATGTEGTTYSTGLTTHPEVLSDSYDAHQVAIKARFAGSAGNGIVTTTTGANLAWSNGSTLLGGVGGVTSAVPTPDDIGIFDVVTIASYVVCIPTQVDEFIGRFYWIKPGEKTIDSLDFATAESYPDRIVGVRRFGDQFWLPGEKSTEVWYPTGDPQAPMLRLQGVVFDRGGWEGTVVALKESLFLVDPDGGVFIVRGGQPQRVSNPGIEEEIRKAITEQAIYT